MPSSSVFVELSGPSTVTQQTGGNGVNANFDIDVRYPSTTTKLKYH